MQKSPLKYETIDEINKEIPIYLKRYIGQGAFVSDKQKLDNDTYIWFIGNSYPAFYYTPTDAPPTVKFATFKNISTIKIEKNVKTNSFQVFIPSRKELIEKHREKYSSLLTSIENSLLDVTRHNYVKIPFVQTAMSRIISIIEDLDIHSQIDPIDHPKRERNKLMKYLQFLEDLEYVRAEEGIYVEGNRLNIIKYDLNKNEEDRYEILNKILADVIKIGYPYMKKHLRLLQIVPYLRIATAYYYPSYKFNRLISMNRTDLAQYIARYQYSFYKEKKPALDGKPDSKLNKQISDVIRSNILKIKDNIVTGDKTIFREFKNSLPADY